MTAAARRLQSLASLLAHVRERLGVDIGFVLWDDATVPADLKADAMAFRPRSYPEPASSKSVPQPPERKARPRSSRP